MTEMNLEQALQEADLELKQVEIEYGPDDPRLADCLEAYGMLLKDKKIRLLDAANMLARAKVIRETSFAKGDQTAAENRSAANVHQSEFAPTERQQTLLIIGVIVVGLIPGGAIFWWQTQIGVKSIDLFALLVVMVFYFVPSVLAFQRRKKTAGIIFVLNLFVAFFCIFGVLPGILVWLLLFAWSLIPES